MPQPTRFDTEAALRGATGQEPGREAYAADTSNTFKWYPEPVGWVQQNRPADAQLIPDDGTPGQRLIIDPLTEVRGFVSEVEAPTFTASAIDTNVAVTVVTKTIDGGRLGANGYLDCRVAGSFSNEATAAGDTLLRVTPKVSPTIIGAGVNSLFDIDSAAYPIDSTGNQFEIAFRLTNKGQTDRQGAMCRFSIAQDGVQKSDVFLERDTLTTDVVAIDTDAEWTFALDLTMNRTPGADWAVDSVTVETIYLP